MRKTYVLIGLLFVMLLFSGIASAVAPILSDESPSDDSTLWDMDTSSISVQINCSSGTFNWSIDTLPDIGNSSSNGASNGSKTCSISGYSYSTEYTWYVNSTNGTLWTNASYTFTTRNAKLRENAEFTVVEKAIVGVVGIMILIGFIFVVMKTDFKKDGALAKILVGMIVALALLTIIFSSL